MRDEQPQQSKLFEKLKRKAERLAGDNDKLANLLDMVARKIGEITQSNKSVKTVLEMVRTFIRMIRNYISGEYRQIPWKTLVLIVAGLLYFLVPLDFIPDFIPFTGFLDDATVLYWVALGIKDDLDEYLEWERTKVS
jgi:uncharacterized membrane protein YkvA (DUF1232 family)